MGHSNKDSFSQKSSHSSRENVDPFVGGNEGNATIEQKRHFVVKHFDDDYDDDDILPNRL